MINLAKKFGIITFFTGLTSALDSWKICIPKVSETLSAIAIINNPVSKLALVESIELRPTISPILVTIAAVEPKLTFISLFINVNTKANNKINRERFFVNPLFCLILGVLGGTGLERVLSQKSTYWATLLFYFYQGVFANMVCRNAQQSLQSLTNRLVIKQVING